MKPYEGLAGVEKLYVSIYDVMGVFKIRALYKAMAHDPEGWSLLASRLTACFPRLKEVILCEPYSSEPGYDREVIAEITADPELQILATTKLGSLAEFDDLCSYEIVDRIDKQRVPPRY